MKYRLALLFSGLCAALPLFAGPVILDDTASVDDIRRAWEVEVKYRDFGGKTRDPAWYLRADDNLAQAPRTAVKIQFASNSAVILPASHPILAEHAKALQNGGTLLIAGHTDSNGHELYNLGLSYQRAEAVREFLVQRHGLAADRVLVKPYGESRPLAGNDSEAGRALNRRVEFVYLGQSG